MSWNDFLSKMKLYDRNAKVIFDREEPVGRPTDLVLPDKRWFRRAKKTLPVKGSGAISGHNR